MTMRRWGWAVGLAATVFALESARWGSMAQDPPVRSGDRNAANDPVRTQTDPPARGNSRTRATKISVQDALLLPHSLPFAQETTLEELVQYLRRSLDAPVVLDLAALERQDLAPDSTVRLELEGVRLKTGLQLLLDQVGLTYRVIAEDNLLILTDATEASDTTARILAELKSLHRDLHAVQDAVDDLSRLVGPAEEAGPMLKKPTIIEDLPAEPRDKPAERPTRPRPGI